MPWSPSDQEESSAASKSALAGQMLRRMLQRRAWPKLATAMLREVNIAVHRRARKRLQKETRRRGGEVRRTNFKCRRKLEKQSPKEGLPVAEFARIQTNPCSKGIEAKSPIPSAERVEKPTRDASEFWRIQLRTAFCRGFRHVFGLRISLFPRHFTLDLRASPRNE